MEVEKENGNELESIDNYREEEKVKKEDAEGDASIISTRMEEEGLEEEGKGEPSESLQKKIEETARQLQEMGFSPEEVGEIN